MIVKEGNTMERDTGKENDGVISLFNLEYQNIDRAPQFIHGMLHWGTQSQSDAAFMELLRKINDSLDIEDISTLNYYLEKYDYDSDDFDILPEPKGDMTHHPEQIRNWNRKIGLIPVRRINLWEAAIAFALNPEISDYKEFINTYRNAASAIRSGQGIMGHAATQVRLEEVKVKLNAKPDLTIRPSASEKMQEKPKVQNSIKKTVKKTRGI